MSDFKEVSLGFAEFVSQLLQETFESVVAAQNYQYERYAELERLRDMPLSEYITDHIGEAEVVDRAQTYFGVEVAKDMVAKPAFITLLQVLFEDTTGMLTAPQSGNPKLKLKGYKSIRGYFSEEIALEQKSGLDDLVNNSSMARLVVESGEIYTKLELSNLYSTELAAGQGKNRKAKAAPVGRTRLVTENRVKGSLATSKLKVTEVPNEDGAGTTVMVDRDDVANAASAGLSIPALRLIAKPLNATSTSNLFTEVKIKFKTV